MRVTVFLLAVMVWIAMPSVGDAGVARVSGSAAGLTGAASPVAPAQHLPLASTDEMKQVFEPPAALPGPVRGQAPVVLGPTSISRETGPAARRGAPRPRPPARSLGDVRRSFTGRLTGKHSGWRKTACLGCHDTTSMARHKNANLKPTDCGPCHGYNGAPHEAHAIPINPCGMCHARVEHAAAFAAPGDCIKCHVHPASPQGR